MRNGLCIPALVKRAGASLAFVKQSHIERITSREPAKQKKDTVPPHPPAFLAMSHSGDCHCLHRKWHRQVGNCSTKIRHHGGVLQSASLEVAITFTFFINIAKPIASRAGSSHNRLRFGLFDYLILASVRGATATTHSANSY